MAREPKHLYEAAMFWVAIGGPMVVIGGIIVSIGQAQAAVSAHGDLLANRWFDAGLLIVVIGALMLLWGLTVYVKHRRIPPPPPPPQPPGQPPPAPAAPAWVGINLGGPGVHSNVFTNTTIIGPNPTKEGRMADDKKKGKDLIGHISKVSAGDAPPMTRFVAAYVCGGCGTQVGGQSEVVLQDTPVKCPSCEAVQPNPDVR